MPKSETSGAFFERYNKEVPPNETPEEFVNVVTQRETATNGVGQFNLEKSIDLNGVERALDDLCGVSMTTLCMVIKNLAFVLGQIIALAGSDYSRVVRNGRH